MVIKKVVLAIGLLVCSCSVYGGDSGSSEEYRTDVMPLGPRRRSGPFYAQPAALNPVEISDNESTGGRNVNLHDLYDALERQDFTLQEMARNNDLAVQEITRNNIAPLAEALGTVESLRSENADLKQRERCLLLSMLFGMTCALCTTGAALFSIISQPHLVKQG